MRWSKTKRGARPGIDHRLKVRLGLGDVAGARYTVWMLPLINPVERAAPFDHEDWVFEAKFDGLRAVADTVGRSDSKEGKSMSSKPPPEIQSLIDSHVKAFNTQDNNLFFSVFGDTAIIIDGIAPYRWLNPNAPAKWIADVDKWRQDLGVTKEHLSYEIGFWNVEGTSAYAVIVGTLTIMIKDQSIVRAGTLAYTFAKRDGVWKIEAQAWGRTS